MSNITMEKYKKSVQKRIIILSVCTIILAVVFALICFNVFDFIPIGTDFAKGFRDGIFGVSMLILVFCIVDDLVSLKHEDRLKKMFISENDERKSYLDMKAASTSFLIQMFVLLLAALIASCYNTTIFITLVIVLLATTLLKLFVQLVYTKKH